MSIFRITIEAQNDLTEIAKYTEQTWGREQRNIYLGKIEEVLLKLAKQSSLGQACDHIHSGFRYFPIGSHLVYYRIASDNVIEVVRLLHRSMHVDSLENL